MLSETLIDEFVKEGDVEEDMRDELREILMRKHVHQYEQVRTVSRGQFRLCSALILSMHILFVASVVLMLCVNILLIYIMRPNVLAVVSH